MSVYGRKYQNLYFEDIKTLLKNYQTSTRTLFYLSAWVQIFHALVNFYRSSHQYSIPYNRLYSVSWFLFNNTVNTDGNIT